jgi:C-terminal processing protease CtpA/Prc
MRMRPFVLLGAFLAGAIGVQAASVTGTTGTAQKPATAPTPGEVRVYAHNVLNLAHYIAEKYVRPISPEKLMAAALQELYEAAGAPVPEHLRGDLEKALVGRDPMAELQRARLAVGNPEVLRGDRAVRVSLQGMTQVLDPHTGYVALDEQLKHPGRAGFHHGAGLLLEDRLGLGPLVVQSVILGSPAQRAEIRPGDHLLEINGTPTGTMTAAQALAQINLGHDQPAVTSPAAVPMEVVLTLRSARDREIRKIKLNRNAFSFKEEVVLGARRRDGWAWDYLQDHQQKIGLVRVRALHGGPLPQSRQGSAAEEVERVLLDLQAKGMRGLILDLRECPGGGLDVAVWVADLFLGEDLRIAEVRYRNEAESRPYISYREGSFLNFPMTVLIGPDTSGGGELIAAALQDHKRARVAGQRSRGKASVQQTRTDIAIPGVQELRITTGLFHRPSGRNLQRFSESKPTDDWGVVPDPDGEVRLSPQLERQLRAWRLLQDVRSGDSHEILPLDDPDADPVLALALEELRKALR